MSVADQHEPQGLPAWHGRPGPHAQHMMMRHHGEDWSGISNQRQRKKLQNRLNQRLSRQRRRGKESPSSSASSVSPSSPSPSLSSASPSWSASSSTSSSSPSPASSYSPPASYSTSLSVVPAVFSNCTEEDLPHKRAVLARFAEHALASYRAGNPSADHRLRIIQLNTINGLTCNAAALGFTFDWLVCETLSPFGPVPASGTLARPPAALTCRTHAGEPLAAPRSLAPTAKQRSVAHHPWLDLFPLPRMRDNLIAACTAHLSAEDEERLFQDIMESGGTTRSEWAGLGIWGDPWDPYSWEVSVPFLRNWGWLIRGCPELIVSTNHWRRQRGEEPIADPDSARIEELPDGYDVV
ncbi:hypothetical protein Micbo1qcDRAFT_197590 [Microdochium bolleyi]|uniref:BZIP domain-containing protein n=1 Tax=Microdochium bolleyi TaxID=196109 RepID=A0A136IT75_9PEZI|nr:hypothetical protein Micbo1qcDRAFT_197590 [Microdochium bolleyi]